MQRLLGILALILSLIARPAVGQQTILPTAISVAEAEVERVAPPEASMLGHHGVVVLVGDVTPEGRSANMVLTESSRSSILDQFAIITYGNVKLGADLLSTRPKKIRLKINLDNYDFDHIGLGYKCEQAVRDNEWWAKTFPEVPLEQTKFLLFAGGLGFVDARMKFMQDPKRRSEALQKATQFCRDHPSASFLGALALAGKS